MCYSNDVMKRALKKYGCNCDNCCSALLTEETIKDDRLKALARVASKLSDVDLKEVEIFAEFLRRGRK